MSMQLLDRLDEGTSACLSGAIVMHEIDGVGRIISIQDSKVTLEIGRPAMTPLLKDTRAIPPGSAGSALFDIMAQEEPGMKVSMDEEMFINHPMWTLAPTKERFQKVCNEIATTYSPVVVPTLNPPNPVVAKDNVEARVHKMLLRNPRPTFDEDFIALRNQLTFLIDSQLSYYLIRGEESYWDYQERLSAFTSYMESDMSWGRILFNEADLDANERILEYANVLAHLTVNYNGGSYSSAISRVISLFEARIKLYKFAIRGFTRSKNKR